MIDRRIWSGVPRRRKAPQEIAHRIRTQILTGSLPYGSKLPSEQELMTHLSVSRQTLREALRVLETQGLLDIRAGLNGGAFVSDVDEKTASIGLINFLHSRQICLEHLAEVRRLIEPDIAVEAANKITPEQLSELEDLQERAREELNNKKILALREIEISFHSKIASIGGNPLLIFIDGFIGNLLLGVKQKLKPDENFSVSVIRKHDCIVEALKNHDASAARQAMLDDIESVMNVLSELAEGQGMVNWKLVID